MSDEQVLTVERVRVLHGHADEATAYLVDHYPYGGLRCKIRYWVETATKGAKKGQQRYVQQTTNPKRPGEPWNKPHPCTYDPMVVLYLDGKSHVQWWGSGLWIRPERDARTRLMGIYDQLADEQRRRYDRFLEVSRRNDSHWHEFDERVDALAAEIGYTGEVPAIVDGVWKLPGGGLVWLGTENVPVYLTLARQRLAAEHG